MWSVLPRSSPGRCWTGGGLQKPLNGWCSVDPHCVFLEVSCKTQNSPMRCLGFLSEGGGGMSSPHLRVWADERL